MSVTDVLRARAVEQRGQRPEDNPIGDMLRFRAHIKWGLPRWKVRP